MHTRAIEILALKLAQAEMNHAILQARLEQAEYELQEAKAKLEELEAQNGIIEQNTKL